MKIALDINGWRETAKTERCWGVPDNTSPQFVKFVLPDATNVITARVVDDGASIEIFPDRSSGHAMLRAALGA